MEYEVNSKPFDEHELVDDVIEADSVLDAALMFARGKTEQHVVYVRELGSSKAIAITVAAVVPDASLIEAVAWRLRQAAFFAQCPSPSAHVLAKSWMTQAFYHGGRIVDFETRVRAVQLLIHFDLFVADEIARRDHARN
jgi:hypothetical protein